MAKESGDRRGGGNWLGNLGGVCYYLGESRKAIEFLKKSLAIGKSIEDPGMISFCEHILKDLEESSQYQNPVMNIRLKIINIKRILYRKINSLSKSEK